MQLLVQLILAILILFGGNLGYSQNLPDNAVQREGVLRALASKSASLHELRAFVCDGTGYVAHTDAMLALVQEPIREEARKMAFKFHIIGEGKRLKISLDFLNQDGSIKRSEIYYQDDERLILVEKSAESQANIIPRSNIKVGDGIFNVCPLFFENSFVSGNINEFGLPALDVDTLANEELWKLASNRVAAVTRDDERNLVAVLESDKSSAKITFAHSKTGGRELAIENVKFFRANDSLLSELRVMAARNIEPIGRIATKMELDTYVPLTGSEILTHVATWHYEIERISLNPALSGEMLAFDPLEVDRIWDAESAVWIPVPR